MLNRWLEAIENGLVYLPSRTVTATPAHFGLDFERIELTADDGVVTAAWAIPSGEARPWLLYFHGNGANVAHYLPFAAALHRLGLNLLLPEYRGYGESSGVPSEAGLYKDAQAAYRHLSARGVAPDHLAVYGFSLGSGVAVELASRENVGALLLEAPFTSLPDVARATYRIVPSGLMRNLYQSAQKIRKVRSPLLVLHSPADIVVPYRLGRRLFELGRGPKAFVELTGGHSELVNRPNPEVLLELARFLRRHLPGGRGQGQPGMRDRPASPQSGARRSPRT